MTPQGPRVPESRQGIVADLTGMIADIIQDWDLDFSGGITESTGLVSDLGFQSIDVVMLVGEVHRLYGRRDLPFEKLLAAGGAYAREITVRDLADFLHAHLNGNGGAASSHPAGERA